MHWPFKGKLFKLKIHNIYATRLYSFYIYVNLYVIKYYLRLIFIYIFNFQFFYL